MERSARWFIVLLSLMLTAAACADARAVDSAESNEPPAGPIVEAEPTTPTTVAESSLPTTPPLPTLPPPPPPPDPVTVLAAGNLGACSADSEQVSAAMVEALAADDAAVVLAAGDLSTDGTAASLDDCFASVFADDLDRVLAVPGDRDLETEDGAAFYELLGSTATSTIPGQGWFVAELGGWQIIGINSRCADVGGCDVGSIQYRWLDDLLKADDVQCRAVVWHDARFTSARRVTPARDMGPIVGRLDGAGVDVLITGSVDNYERLGPLRPSGAPAEGFQNGVRHFNIGGGDSASFFDELAPGSEARIDDTPGYVRFVFGPDGYTWEFVATSDAASPAEAGAADCGSSDE